jgi:hypothetical protein
LQASEIASDKESSTQVDVAEESESVFILGSGGDNFDFEMSLEDFAEFDFLLRSLQLSIILSPVGKKTHIDDASDASQAAQSLQDPLAGDGADEQSMQSSLSAAEHAPLAAAQRPAA